MTARLPTPTSVGTATRRRPGAVGLWTAAIVMALGAAAASSLMYMLSYSCPPEPFLGGPPSDIGCVTVTFWGAGIRLGNVNLPLAPAFVLLLLGSGLAGIGAFRARRRKKDELA